MDECHRLQSENIALRQMLQNALDNGPGAEGNSPRARGRSNSRGRKELTQSVGRGDSMVKAGLSFVAEKRKSQGRSISPPLSRLDNVIFSEVHYAHSIRNTYDTIHGI